MILNTPKWGGNLCPICHRIFYIDDIHPKIRIYCIRCLEKSISGKVAINDS